MRTPQWFQRTPDTKPDKDLWWVRLILNVGRPVVAVFVLAMCAPGEHYLARQAGWSELLAWGMPGTLTAYAGIAAVVATKRPPGTPGKATAVWGAVLSIALAMAAQPIAHLYGRPGLVTQQVVLICVVSCIPAAVFGHLLHMAAVRTPDTAGQNEVSVSAPDMVDLVRTGMDSGIVSEPQWLADNTVAADKVGLSVSGLMSAPDSPPDMSRWTPDTDTAGQDGPSWTITPKVSAPRVRRTQDGSVGGHAKELLSADPDISDEDMRTAILDKFGPDTKPDAMRKAIKRARTAA